MKASERRPPGWPRVDAPDAMVTAVSRSPVHGFSKEVVSEIRIIAGLGVEGDAHAGSTVRHRFRVRIDPTAPNLCQVHLIDEELFAELSRLGLAVAPGQMGENVIVRGLDLLELPVAARLRLGAEAEVQITGLRDPCGQLDALRPGLMRACLGRDKQGQVVRKAGVMALAVRSGRVQAGDAVRVELPAGAWMRLGPV